MIVHDLSCNNCGLLRRDVLLKHVEDIALLPPCQCGGRFEVIWLKAPAVVGTETGATWFRPGYNIQLGRYFSSFDEHQKYIKAKGITIQGPDEFRRTQAAIPLEPPEPKLEGFKDAMKEAWDETIIGGKIVLPKKLDETPTIAVDS
jgi:hypothetical protein